MNRLSPQLSVIKRRKLLEGVAGWLVNQPEFTRPAKNLTSPAGDLDVTGGALITPGGRKVSRRSSGFSERKKDRPASRRGAERG